MYGLRQTLIVGIVENDETFNISPNTCRYRISRDEFMGPPRKANVIFFLQIIKDCQLTIDYN